MSESTDMAPYLSLTDQRRLKITLPSITDQRVIARVLGALDDKVELNRRLNRSLEELAQAVFRSWFVDFDPVTAKASGRPPIGLDPTTAALFPNEFQDSELGEIPKGWRVGCLADIADVTMGTSPSGDTYNDVGNGTPLINGPVEYGDFFPVKIKWTTEPTRFCQNDDLIFCVRGSTTGRRVVADDVYCLGRGVCSIHGRDGNQGFVDLAVEQGMDSLLSRATGSTFPNLNGPEIKGLSLVIPTDPILKRFAEVVDPLRNQVRSNIREQHALAAARDALLPPLLSGELRVPDAERFVEQLV